MTAQTEFKEGRVEARGLSIRYLEAGQGDTIVAVDSLTWGTPKLYHALAQKYRVVVLEAPQLGGGSPSKSSKALAGITALAAASLAPGDYSLIGTSLSANVALWQALQAPAKIEALVLISPTAILPTGGPPEAAGSRPVQSLLTHPENAPGPPQPDPALAAAEKALVHLLKEVAHDAEAESRLGEIQCATLAVFGLEDKMVSPEAARVYRARIPNCNISLVYDAGHLIEAERPEALINLVSDFVERRETFIVGRESRVINP
ncbi:MAG: hypothetical protein BZY80_05380 [SAR202 cluster bacterium Io17-Chloro-G2]|nr:MAG: hypothetical protein BZY80_05380 [SAR202 cluster bacterium Io17-Chloro-G2]